MVADFGVRSFRYFLVRSFRYFTLVAERGRGGRSGFPGTFSPWTSQRCYPLKRRRLSAAKDPPSTTLGSKCVCGTRSRILDVLGRALELILQMGAVARQVHMTAGSDANVRGDGGDHIWNILREYLAPDAVDSGQWIKQRAYSWKASTYLDARQNLRI